MAAKLTYELLITKISECHCKISMPQLSDDLDKDKERLNSRLDTLYNSYVRARLRSPGNEKDQWTPSETSLDILPMDTKTKSGKSQVGDYHIEYSINGEPWINSGLCIERKEVSDANNTFLFKYDRFMDEIQRFENSDELFHFRIFIEGSYDDFMNYTSPVPLICKCCSFVQPYHDNKKNIHKYYCTFDVLSRKADTPREIKPLSTCDFCVPHKKTDDELEALRKRKSGIVEDLISDGYFVSFYGSRENAAGAMPTVARRYFCANYSRILDL
jgi:hypothetical protein